MINAKCKMSVPSRRKRVRRVCRQKCAKVKVG